MGGVVWREGQARSRGIKSNKSNQKTKMANIDKLVLVSKLLIDQRFLELKQENEGLKLELFWKKYNVAKLKREMESWNLLCGPQCKCIKCCGGGLAGDYELEDIQQRVCGFKPAFEGLATVHGLMLGNASHSADKRLPHVSNDKYGGVFDIDAHIIQEHYGLGWNYGAKLWKARSVSDPELKKLVALFEAMNTQTRIALDF